MSTAEKIAKVAQEAQDAFWAKVAELYPEIKTGDLDPWTVMKFDRDCANVILAWVDANREVKDEEV